MTYKEDERLKDIMQGIDYAVKEGLLEPSEARKMTLEEQEAWIEERFR